MSYYVRLLTPNARKVDIEALRSAISKEGYSATLEADTDSRPNWSELVLAHSDGDEIAVIERNDVLPGELGEEELEEFRESIKEARPATAARWLGNYFDRVKVIYAFQVLHGTELEDGWSILNTVKGAMWSTSGGIFQSDAEGFSNEAGYHILWQFNSDVSGPWSMAVLDENGNWSMFEMELSDQQHREAFLSGQVPDVRT